MIKKLSFLWLVLFLSSGAIAMELLEFPKVEGERIQDCADRFLEAMKMDEGLKPILVNALKNTFRSDHYELLNFIVRDGLDMDEKLLKNRIEKFRNKNLNIVDDGSWGEPIVIDTPCHTWKLKTNHYPY